MVFAPYSRIEAESDALLDSVPQAVDNNTIMQRDRSQSSPPRPSFRPTNRSRAISDPFYAQNTNWHPLNDVDDEEDDDRQDLLSSSRPALPRKKSSFGVFKQGVLKAVGIKP
ncbi:hypothetical protein INT44_005876 [Umbelopsis vinacea]|uniref:Uncharacterized protein n=1 Tax=Umbelopsis vinacea TaxID=44442 RepID=A0A8H7Q063_9FUNG|nr:hypothetical protein INT44_005876 [Umbelopsis vinacea]